MAQDPAAEHAAYLAERGFVIPGVNDRSDRYAAPARANETQSGSDPVNFTASFQAYDGTIASPSTPKQIASGDFNEDGLPDVVVANRDSTVSVYLDNFNARLDPPIKYPAGPLAADVAVGDFNGDGNLDLAVINRVSGNVGSILNGDGAGNFGAPTSIGGGVAGWTPTSIAALRIDGGSTIDLAVTMQAPSASAPGTLNTFLGNGNSTFSAGPTLPTGIGPTQVRKGDFDGDGREEVAVANAGDPTSHQGSVTVTHNSGTGLDSVWTYNTGLDTRSLAIGDVDGGGPEIVAGNYTSGSASGTVSVLHNDYSSMDPSTKFTKPNPDMPVGGNPQGVAIGDFNLDGNPDIATANFGAQGKTATVAWGDALRTFGVKTDLTTAGTGESIIAVDLNYDGKMGLVMPNSVKLVSMLNEGAGGLFGASDRYGETIKPAAITAGNFNGDSFADVVAVGTNDAGSAPFISVRPGTAGGGLGAATVIADSPGASRSEMRKADLDVDGNDDVILNGQPATTINYGNGDGTFTRVDIPSSASSSVLIAQLDNAGQSDLVWSEFGGSILHARLSTGGRSFGAASNVAFTGTGASYLSGGNLLSATAFNPVVVTASGVITIFANNGAGSLTPSTTLNPGGTPTGIAVGNLFGGGRPSGSLTDDIVITSSLSGAVHIYKNFGNGTFEDKGVFPIGTGNNLRIRLADLDGDGVLEIMTVNQSTNTVGILKANAGVFSQRSEFGTEVQPSDFAVVDATGDGRLDLFVAAKNGKAITLLRNTNGDFVTAVEPGSPPRISGIELAPPSPNPSSGNAVFRFAIREADMVSGSIHDIQGRLVTDLVDEFLPAGRHEIRWDGLDRNGARVGAGVYLCVIEAGREAVAKKITIIR